MSRFGVAIWYPTSGTVLVPERGNDYGRALAASTWADAVTIARERGARMLVDLTGRWSVSFS